MIQPLQKLQLIVDHLLISAHALLEDDFNGDFALRGVGFANDAVGACAEGSTESVQRPEQSPLASIHLSDCLVQYLLFFITLRLTLQLIEHTRDYTRQKSTVSLSFFAYPLIPSDSHDELHVI